MGDNNARAAAAPYTITNRPKRPNPDKITDIVPVIQKFALFTKIQLRAAACLRHQGSDFLASCIYFTFDLSDEVYDALFLVHTNATPPQAPTPRPMINTPEMVATLASNPTVTKERVNTVIVMCGYAAITTLAKEITAENVSYVHSRLRAIGASCKNIPLQELNLSLVSETLSPQSLSDLRIRISAMGVTDKLIEDILTNEPETDMGKATITSIKMVFSGYGLTSAEQMYYFTTIVTKAHLLTIVLDECEAYRKAYKKYQERHPENWDLGRVLGLPGVETLDNSKYPHLYTCAIARAQGPNKDGLKRYTKSNFNLKESAQTLERLSTTYISAETKLTQDLANRLFELSGKDLTAHVGQIIEHI